MASEKKRKRTEDAESEHRSKKRHAASESDTIQISVAHSSKKELMPILAVPVGLAMPHYAMKTYQKNFKNDETPFSRRPLMLHSSEHPRLDYIATEEFDNCGEGALKHYVGIYDPAAAEMELIAVKKMAVRTVLRPTQEEVEERSRQREYQTMLSQRQALGMEFGTKKSKKAIQSLAENAIIAAGKPNAATKALITAIGDNIVDMPTREDLAATADANKPRPAANLAAEYVQDVYPINRLIDADTAGALDVSDWQGAASEGTGISTTSKYVSRRLHSVIQNNDRTKLKVLRYMLMIIEYFQRLRPTRGGQLIPKRAELEKLGHPYHLIEGIRKRFAPESIMSPWSVTNLMTHVLAMALFVDDYNVDTEDLKDDFKLEYRKMTELYRSLGCKVTAPSERERAHMQMTAVELKQRKMARLVLPLDFPKTSLGKRQAKKR